MSNFSMALQIVQLDQTLFYLNYLQLESNWTFLLTKTI